MGSSKEDLLFSQAETFMFQLWKCAQEEHDLQMGWEFVKNAFDVDICKRIEPNSKIQAVRGKGRISASPREISQVIRGIELTGSWDSFFKGGRVVECFDNNHQILHSRYSLDAPLVRDREFVFLETFKEYEDGSIVVCCFSVERDDVPPLPTCVRGEMILSGWIITPLRTDCEVCDVTYVVHVDPKGWIPSVVVNFVAIEEPLSINRLRMFLEKRRKNPYATLYRQKVPLKV